MLCTGRACRRGQLFKITVCLMLPPTNSSGGLTSGRASGRYGLCPVKCAPLDEQSFSHGSVQAEMLLDVGIWDMGPQDARAFIKLNREFEAKVTELRGMKCLYAHAYYTEQEFWSIYNEKRYMELRTRYHAESLPSIFDKVKVDLQGVEQGAVRVNRALSWREWAYVQFWSTWPFGGLYGVASATKGLLLGGDFLLKK